MSGAALFWILRRTDSTGFHRFVFPYVIVAGVAAILLAISPLLEIFVANYSGAIHEIEVIHNRSTGAYRWIHSALSALPFFPFLGILPAIGSRPWLMAGIGVIASLPDLYLLCAPALFSFLR